MRKQHTLALIAAIILLASCSKENSKPEKGRVVISCELEYQLSTGETMSKAARAGIFIWPADSGRVYSESPDPSDLSDGYNYDSTTERSYHFIGETIGYSLTTALNPGRYFVFVILYPEDADAVPRFSNSSTYFTISGGDSKKVIKIFDKNTISDYYQAW